MSVIEWFLVASAFVSLCAVVMMIVNLRLYPAAPRSSAAKPSASDGPLVTVCIPARNEEENLEPCVRSVLAGDLTDIEVLVYNDQSTDRTGEILSRLISQDSRVRAATTQPLPDGWNGKQHGCWQMARGAKGSWLVFTDADVRFSADALRRSLAAAEASGAALVSTFPRQITGSIGEALVVPLIHFVLLSYLPFARMKSTLSPAASAGCGQFLMARRDAYFTSGGHERFKASMHDGVKMPRAFRAAGLKTDLFDGTDLVSVRMYRGFGATWRGFAKNAYEGLGSLGLLVFVTVLHVVAYVLPPVYLVASALGAAHTPLGVGLAAAALVWGIGQRMYLAVRFEQSFLGALLHPVGIVLLTLIQWWSLYLSLVGKRTWRGRVATG